jgi:polyisoprenoid-binding protein YceI
VTDLTARSSSPKSKHVPSRSRGDAGIVVLVLLAVVLVAGAGIWYFVFRDTAPEKANIRSATKSVDQPDSSSSSSSDLDGSWGVNTSIGDFDADAEIYSSSWLGYRVQEELVGIGAKTAFGRTPEVTGSMTIEGTSVTAVEVEGDLTALVSDSSRRDDSLSRQSIETSQFPTATFELTAPIDFGDVSDGETLSVDATGDLTIHGVTKAVTIALEASLENNTIVVTGSIGIIFADYDIEKPTAASVLSVDDHGEMELQLFFTKQ